MKKIIYSVVALFAATLFPLLSFAQISVQLTATDYNGSNISCNGLEDGAIDLTITGGIAPYTFLWSNGATIQNLIDLPAGDYTVTVTDSNNLEADEQITMTEPEALHFDVNGSLYPSTSTSVATQISGSASSFSNYNVSVFGAADGWLSVHPTGGSGSYTFNWDTTHVVPSSLGDAIGGVSSSGSAGSEEERTWISGTDSIANLAPGPYYVKVTDANGCTVTDVIFINDQAPDFWYTSGNTNINTAHQFIGSTDSTDVIFKANNIEAARIRPNGIIEFSAGLKVDSASTDSLRAVYANQDGILKTTGTGGNNNDCIQLTNHWHTDVCSNANDIFNAPQSGRVGIGTKTPTQKLEIKHNDADGGIAINKTSDGTDSKKSEIKFNYNGNKKWAIGNDLNGDGSQNFFIKDNASSHTRFLIDEDGRVGIGVTPPSLWASGAVHYMLYVEGGIKTKDVKVTTSPFPDYVFNTSYQLMSIYELEQFIKQNKHLPGIPSAKEIEKNDGYELGDMVQKLLQKTEEQSLYIIDLQKQVDELKANINKKQK
jgi:hypothetical protein